MKANEKEPLRLANNLIKKTSSLTALPSVPDLEYLGLSVPKNDSHEYVLSNRDTMHWTGESNKSETRKWQGLVKERWTTITNFWLDTQSETTSNHIINTTIYPHAVKTSFQKPTGTFDELFWLVRNKDVLIIQYQGDFSGAVFFRPQFGMRKDWSAAGSDCEAVFNPTQNFLSISTTSPYGGPEIVGIKISEVSTFIKEKQEIPQTYKKDDFRGDGSDVEKTIQLGKLQFSMTPGIPIYIIITLGNSEAEVEQTANDSLSNYNELWEMTTQPLVDLLTKTKIDIGNETWNRALQWAQISIDSLTMNVTGRGLYAGLHWFPEYWGRDSFISFRGSVLTTGRFEIAKELIRTMIANQDKNPDSSTYGRVPNIIQIDAQNPNYETADGTGWFIHSIWDFFEYSGFDSEFLIEIWPAIKTAILGEISRTDGEGFLTHGDRETWMDAQTGGIIASPRGNRAVEIQALYFTELDIARRLASIMNETNFNNQCTQLMQSLKQKFSERFWDPVDEALFDHLNGDETPDTQKRPNEIFAITIPLADNPLLSIYQSEKVLTDVLTYCHASHGIRSLSSTDSNYHPYHDYGSRSGTEHHDFSYHNGDVWLWLSGPVIEAAIRLNKIEIAKNLTDVLIKRILSQDALGTLAEIMDGTDSYPFGHSRGTISQSWSLAELLRIFYQYWLGIQPQEHNRTLFLTPKIPTGLSNKTTLQIYQNKGTIGVEYNRTEAGNLEIHLTPMNFTDPISLSLQIPADEVKGNPVLIDETNEYNFNSKIIGNEIEYHLNIENYIAAEKKFTIVFNGTKPIFKINSPTENRTYGIGENIPFNLTLLSSESSVNYEWTSDQDGLINTTPSFSRSDLSPGRHEITIIVTNNQAISMKKIWISIGNIAPLVRVQEPVNNSTIEAFHPIRLASKARDPNPDDIVQAYWFSNIDGHIFTGLNGTAEFSAGKHTLSVFFSDGKVNVTNVIFVESISQRVVVDGNSSEWSSVVLEENSFSLISGEFVWNDALGDDIGDGDYVYPTYDLPWSADLSGIHLTSDEYALYFLVEFNRPASTSWAQRMSSIFLGLNFENGGFNTITTIFSASHPLSVSINPLISPELVIFATAQSEINVRDLENLDISGASTAAINGNTIEIELPWNLLTSYVEVGSQFEIDFVLCSFVYDDTGSGFGAGGARQVTSSKTQWTGGGGLDSTWNPNIYDVAFTPTTEMQTIMLSNYSAGIHYATLNRALKLSFNQNVIIQASLGLPFPEIQTTVSTTEDTSLYSSDSINTKSSGINPPIFSILNVLALLILMQISTHKRREE